MKDTNEIHPTAVIHSKAILGRYNYIGPFVTVGPEVSIGSHNRIEAHASIGMPAEKHGFFESFGQVFIGSNNVIREHTTINGGTTGFTSMANRCLMLRGSHLSHDSQLENDVTVSCSVLIGGESHIMRGANLGLGSIMHQRSVIGSYAMLGMAAVVVRTSTVRPGEIWVGNPARFLKENKIGLDRAAVTAEQLAEESVRWATILASKRA